MGTSSDKTCFPNLLHGRVWRKERKPEAYGKTRQRNGTKLEENDASDVDSQHRG